MNAFASRHAIIIGGGASGVLLAYQLLQRSTPDFRITLIEKRPEIGRGLAYHTGNPEHVLNVRVANMSALPDEPDHFWRWLTSREDVPPPCPDPYCFVPRRIYGDYIASLLTISKGRSQHRLSIVQGTCVDVPVGFHTFSGSSAIAVSVSSSSSSSGSKWNSCSILRTVSTRPGCENWR